MPDGGKRCWIVAQVKRAAASTTVQQLIAGTAEYDRAPASIATAQAVSYLLELIVEWGWLAAF
jgi:hypothetical protein